MVKMDKGTALVPSRSGSTQKMAANITVVVRVRPMNDKELGQNNRTVVEVLDENQIVFDPKEDLPPFFYQGVQQPSKNYLKRANKELKFAFDSVFGPNATNQDVFESATKDMLAALMEGYNCSVFAYGATGAGKTFTMIGSKEYPGITYLTMDHLFQTINGFQIDREFDIGVSYIEVYNENVFDLLKPSSTRLQLRDFHQYGVMVAGLSIHKIQTAQELLDMLEFGNQNRTQHPTDANAESSRSHAVFQVYLKMRCKTSSQCRMVKLSMIDLAGSERASATGCVGDRFKEGANINRSLLALGKCINRLADGSTYIPYRDSKLTRLLKDSLGGNCKTVMIANVSPSSVSYEDTYNTLKYAARANKIQLSIKKNIIDGNMNSSQCMKVNKELQRRLEEEEKKNQEAVAKMERKINELQAKLAVSTNPVTVDSNMLAKQASWSQRINELELAHGALESKLLTLMSQQRVVALRHFLRTRAFEHVADLAHRSSCDALEQICTEEIPRQERAAENYVQKHVSWNLKIMDVWKKWAESGKKLQDILNVCLADCPYLCDYVDKIILQSKYRISEARNDLKDNLCSIMKDEITVSTECMSDAFNMLKKVYLTLKGYGHAPPALTMEYLEIINKVKSAKSISWSDDIKTDPHFKFISTLDLDNPTAPLDFNQEQDVKNTTVDVITDSEDLTDIENRDPCPKKRKGTPIKLQNNETIIINDSLEALDAQNINSAKKMKIDPRADMENFNNFAALDPADLNSTFVLTGKVDELRKLPVKVEPKEVQPVKKGLTDRTNTIQRTENKKMKIDPRADMENFNNFAALDPADLNSTFVFAGKMDELRKLPVKVEPKEVQPVKKGLTDRTNTIQRTINFNNDIKTRIVKPVMPVKQVGTALPQTRGPAFGSSVARDGSNLRTVQGGSRKAPVTERSVGFKAVRARERTQAHPYSRPAAFAAARK